MTTVYFVRHAEPNFSNHDDVSRELTTKGLEDRKLVTEFFAGKEVDAVLSSPYKRSVQTVEHFARSRNMPITAVWDFRERKVESAWIEDFDGFCRYQWSDFDYKLSDGETLREVQTRNIAALHDVLVKYCGKTVVIGSHGTALSTIINHYEPSFGYEDFRRIKNIMPWVVKFTFQGQEYIRFEEFDLFA